MSNTTDNLLNSSVRANFEMKSRSIQADLESLFFQKWLTSVLKYYMALRFNFRDDERKNNIWRPWQSQLDLFAQQ